VLHAEKFPCISQHLCAKAQFVGELDRSLKLSGAKARLSARESVVCFIFSSMLCSEAIVLFFPSGCALSAK
jgi:hypothetical protein